MKFSPTFIVDSDAALAAWASNQAGNDYSFVLIKKGDYYSTQTVYLGTAGTIGVVGEPGSMLHFHMESGGTMDGIYGSGQMEEFLFNVHLECDDESGFFDCRNLYHCSAHSGYGFWRCENLFGCYSEDINRSGFNECISLTNCYVKNVYSGFMSCENVVNCRAVACNFHAFSECSRLTHCTAEEGGIGFYSCRTMFGCRSVKNTTDYSGCYMTENNSYPVANTSVGGYNS